MLFGLEAGGQLFVCEYEHEVGGYYLSIVVSVRLVDNIFCECEAGGQCHVSVSVTECEAGG